MPVSPIKFDLSDDELKDVQRQMKNKKFIGGPLKDFLSSSVFEVEAIAKEDAPVDTGRYRGSITTDVAPTQAVVGSNLEYAPTLEFGQRPGKRPPVEPIEKWARRKGFTNPRGAAFSIARRIFQQGREGYKTLTRAMDTASPKIDMHLRSMISAIETKWRRNG